MSSKYLLLCIEYIFGCASLAKLVKAPNFGLGDCGFESFKVLKIRGKIQVRIGFK